jgi:signal transduction histidine kinase
MPDNTENFNPLTNAMLLMEQIGSSLPFGIMISNMDGIVFYKNNVFESWMPEYPLVNKLWFIQMQPHLDPEHEQNNELKDKSVDWLLETGISQDTMIEVNWQGQKLAFKIRTSPLQNDRHQVCGFVEITENVTEIKQLEKSLQHARRFETVGRLASGIAHDFNNILQVINGHSEMLLESYKQDPRLIKSLDVILTSGQKASALTKQLLMFSRRQQNEFKQINLGTLLNNMQKILCRMLGEDIVMKSSYNDKGICIDGDESQVEQIIMNLAINARDAMPNGGEINIVVELCEL